MSWDYKPPESIAKIGVFLSEPLPEDHSALLTHIRGLVAVCYDVDKDIAEWLKLLHESRAKVLWPKEMDKEKLTELDRKTRMDASIAVIEADYELLLRIASLARLRLELAIKILENAPRKAKP